MTKKVKHFALWSILLFVAISFCCMYWIPYYKYCKKILAQERIEIETKAFKATTVGTDWHIQIKEDYFPPKTADVGVIYNDVFYGLISDENDIYLPILLAKKVEIIILPMDVDDNYIANDSFVLEH